MNIQDIQRLKIVLNLYDFLNANNINIITRDNTITNQLDMFFLGFLSCDNRYINMRRLIPKGKLSSNIDKRYINYNIYGSTDNDTRYYIIPTAINPINHVDIRIAEGPFDILGIYYNTDHGNYSNTIFAAIGGKSYTTIIKYFITRCGFVNFNLHIYLDNDIDDYEIYKIKNILSYNYNIKIYMHRNLYPNEKDFGVPRDRIDEKIMQV